MSPRHRSVLVGIMIGAAFAPICVEVAGYLAAIAAPPWVIPLLRQRWGMFAWGVVTMSLPLALLSLLVSTLVRAVWPGLDRGWVQWAVMGWVGATVAMFGADWLVSAFDNVSNAAHIVLLVALVWCGFASGLRIAGNHSAAEA